MQIYQQDELVVGDWGLWKMAQIQICFFLSKKGSIRNRALQSNMFKVVVF